MNLLNELIQIESTSVENINKAIEFCADYIGKKGISGKVLKNNGFKSYVATIGQGERTLILNGHLDVVSGDRAQFNPVEKEGKIIGRGSADMKGGCVAMINAFIALQNEELPCRIMLQLVPDEETGGKNGTGFLVEQGYTGDFVICTEPTNLKISIKTKGIINLFIETTGISAHGSRPWEGENAISKAFGNFQRIENLDILKEGSQYYKSSSVNLGKISGGDILNRVPDKCLMGLDIRYVPHLDPDRIIEEMKKVTDGEITVGMVEPGVNTREDDLYVKKLTESVSRVIPGEAVELSVQQGGSDGRYFSYKGIPAVELGPKGNYWHGENEYVEKKSIVQLEEILIDFAKSF